MKNIENIKLGDWLRYDFVDPDDNIRKEKYIHISNFSRHVNNQSISVEGETFTCPCNGEGDYKIIEHECLEIGQDDYDSTVIVGRSAGLHRYLEMAQSNGLNFFYKDLFDEFKKKGGSCFKFDTPNGEVILIRISGCFQTRYELNFNCDFKIVLKVGDSITVDSVEIKKNTILTIPKEWFKYMNYKELSVNELNEFVSDMVNWFIENKKKDDENKEKGSDELCPRCS